MEDLTRLVVDSLARHGYPGAVDHRRLEWSRWFRCESSFSLLLVPSAAGLYALGEEVLAPGELASANGKRLLAVFQVAETEDLCVALSRLFAPRNPLSARLSAGRCFVRFAVVTDPHQRQDACESLNRWLASSAEIASGFGKDFSKDFTLTGEVAAFPSPAEQKHPSGSAGEKEPPPLPAGF